jgi:ribosomal protein L7/L12
VKPFTTEAKNEVLRMLASGERLQAIQYLRDTFDISLDEATLLVSTLEKENALDGIAEKPSEAPDSSPNSSPVSENFKSEIIEKIRSGKKIEAIRDVKNMMKVSLKEAVQIVDDIHYSFEPNFKPVRLGDGCAAKVLRVVAFLFLAVALFCFGTALIVYSVQSDTIRNGAKVSGRVTGFQYSGDGGAAPTIEYDLRGAHKTFQSQLFSTPPSFAVNEEVVLYINEEKPDEIVVDVFSERWLGIVVFAAAGAFFVILMIIFLFVSRKL